MKEMAEHPFLSTVGTGGHPQPHKKHFGNGLLLVLSNAANSGEVACELATRGHCGAPSQHASVVHSVTCSIVFPGALTIPEIPGSLYITSFRLRFEPQSASLRTIGGFYRLLDTALRGMPRAAVARLSYPQATVSASRSINAYTPTRLVVKFKDLRSWTLGGDVTRLLPA
ncbi:hypothetical protein F444_06280 [Phytophthora nicotianae P1976]|uniref:Uncharacterized protein n=1 Tax=Phytophthora nicotianae P1976 TaxID=1317066 RepID=A0A081AJ68_PHYNI|nr:hypothetical protein F444_06280 [Phytophthora nicotianae P1976]